MEYFDLGTTILKHVREWIISCEMPPGEKINENNLALKLKISRGPLREVLRMLEKEHLVVHVPRKGTMVSEVSIQELGKIYEVRELVELGAIDLMKKKGIKRLDNLITVVDDAENAVMPNQEIPKDVLLYSEKIISFHIKLIAASDNFYLNEYYKSIYFSLARYQYLHFRYVDPGSKKSPHTHKKILEYIQERKYEEAKRLLSKHIQYSYEFQREILKKYISEKSTRREFV
jgi:DNA-binding GntR family transcriptional regulator